jgi:hypothetical protein
MADNERRTPIDQVKALYEDAETRTAEAVETLVRREGFGELLARVTENAMAMTQLAQGALDMTVRSLRVAGSQDIVRLGRQLNRTEDKLEMVLQEVERLQDELAAQRADVAALGGLFERSERSDGSSSQGPGKGSPSSSARRTGSASRQGGSSARGGSRQGSAGRGGSGSGSAGRRAANGGSSASGSSKSS